MTHEEITRLIEEAARKGGQEALAKHNREDDALTSQKWSAIILCVIGICGVISSVLFFIINAEIDKQLDRRVSPIEVDMALIKQDQTYVKKALEEIKDILQAKK
jgi:hypothetical protein